MATDQQMDAASGAMHQSARELYAAHLVANPRAMTDADLQAAIINGMIAAASDLLWEGRIEGATPEAIAGNVHAASLDILRQLQARQRPQ